MLVLCLIACGLALGAIHPPTGGNAESAVASALASQPPATACMLFLDYREWDFTVRTGWA